MPNLIDSAILIPLIPLLASFFIGLLLVSFNRTINRLTKPVSFILINSILFSTVYVSILFYKHISSELQIKPLRLLNYDYSITLNLNNTSEISMLIIGIIALLVMVASYLRLPRAKGYVRYLISLSSFFGLLFFFALRNSFINIVPFA
ncbi:NAD(P)H-quinone oxidoreductase NdhF subunit, fragment [Prochlorococcus marinus subsp. marinus str. CCMP1375]|uniref:NAD(P)H-quinone oxidoreductase NdhF subunit n=1 Tax=Prochlorococcus marinus (strain SARG / CCMP1375 / SS120) TaxID=167539 RepID=Q7VAR4_PROMA|nr:NAD(P)H-quinone oxidoreductase NdhF subunit, fragment [Prochlorococcus marinus subsp. marinus str. CCMP1375]